MYMVGIMWTAGITHTCISVVDWYNNCEWGHLGPFLQKWCEQQHNLVIGGQLEMHNWVRCEMQCVSAVYLWSDCLRQVNVRYKDGTHLLMEKGWMLKSMISIKNKSSSFKYPEISISNLLVCHGQSAYLLHSEWVTWYISQPHFQVDTYNHLPLWKHHGTCRDQTRDLGVISTRL